MMHAGAADQHLSVRFLVFNHICVLAIDEQVAMLAPRDILCLEATDEVSIDIVGQSVQNDLWVFVIELTNDFPTTV